MVTHPGPVPLSVGYATSDIRYMWQGEQPIQIDRSVQLPQFDVKGHKTEDIVATTSTGERPVSADRPRPVRPRLQPDTAPLHAQIRKNVHVDQARERHTVC